MNLEFNIYKIKEDSSWYQIVKKYNGLNEFIVVGELIKALKLER